MSVTEAGLKTKVERLGERMREAGILPDSYTLRLQVGSAYYGNSSWVAVTGGHHGTGIEPIDALTLPPKATRAQFAAVIDAYAAALHAVRRGAVTWSVANATGAER